MTDLPTRDTDPAPPTAPDHDPPEPSRRQMLERIEALASATMAEVVALRESVEALREDVRAARHAAALAADGALEHRSEVSRAIERLDLIDADGCGRYRAHVRSGNGHREE